MQRAQSIVLHLSLIEEVGPLVCAALIQAFGHDLAHLYEMDAHTLHIRAGIPLVRAERVVAGLADKIMLERELTLLEKDSETQLVTIIDPEYPTLLSAIHAPPTVLYYRGSLGILQKTLAFVGSRNADTYGQQVVDSLVPAVVQEGFATVSGGALGIDGMVHRITLQQGGKTVAILGSGLHQPYPAAHKGLFKEIPFSGGLVMSAFPLLMQPLPRNFPARNRIIAGLAPATLVIQAARKSGALITAHYALEQGREVGVVPGSIFNELSAGCHDLLAQGARGITCPDDIYELIGYASNSGAKPKSSPKKREIAQDPLLSLCITPKSTDELLLKAGYTYDQLQERLWQLQIEGKLEQNMLGMWHVLE